MRPLAVVLLCVNVLVAEPAQTNECPHVSVEEYLNARFIFCRDYIENELVGLYLQNRLDGSPSLLSFADAERFIVHLNEISREGESDRGSPLVEQHELRALLRGLTASEMFTEDVARRYCEFKFPDPSSTELALPEPYDPEPVQELDFFFGCGE